MFKTILVIFLIIAVILGVYEYYTRDDEGEYLTFQVKKYDIDKLSSDYKDFNSYILDVYLCSRNNKEEGQLDGLMKKERIIFLRKIDSKTYEGKVYLTYLKDPTKQYYIVCPAAYTINYIDIMTEAPIDFSDRSQPIVIYWAYPPEKAVDSPY